jgi:hypothetical protein
VRRFKHASSEAAKIVATAIAQLAYLRLAVMLLIPAGVSDAAHH